MFCLNRQSFFLFGLVFLLSSCSKTEMAAKGFYFSGPCKVSVKAEPADSEIFIDGISVGYGIASVEIPCGEKQIMAKKEGYVTHVEYQPVSIDSSLAVEVQLHEGTKVHESFSLSKELIAEIEEGMPIHTPGEKVPELAKDEYPAYLGDMASMLASVKGEKTSDSGAGEEALETGPWTSVDDWR